MTSPTTTCRTILCAGLAATILAAPAQAQRKPRLQAPRDLRPLASPAVTAEPTQVAPPCVLSACKGDPCFGGNTACREFTCPEVAWQVCVQDKQLKGLWVGPVWLKRSPNDAWMQVLYEAGPAEIFTPYHNGDPALRLYDLRHCNPAVHICLRDVFPADAGANGQLVTLSADAKPRVVAEVRDRGVAWLCKWGDGKAGTADDISVTRRGEELLLWGVYDTGNYDFIMQYGFRDDGQIGLRVGATGFNHPDHPFEPHMHDVLWYVDMDLNGAGGDTAFELRHEEPDPTSLQATDYEELFNIGQGAVEGALEWDAKKFGSLLLEDASTNAHGNHRGYELVPFRTGTGRHQGADEGFTRSDFWVTRYNGYERNWVATGEGPDQYLLGSSDLVSGIANQQSIVSTDLVLWHLASAHHKPHDEDQAAGDSGMEGVTLVHWTGADLVPHNLFDQNPLGGPHRSQCEPVCDGCQ